MPPAACSAAITAATPDDTVTDTVQGDEEA